MNNKLNRSGFGYSDGNGWGCGAVYGIEGPNGTFACGHVVKYNDCVTGCGYGWGESSGSGNIWQEGLGSGDELENFDIINTGHMALHGCGMGHGNACGSDNDNEFAIPLVLK
jgi:hypothetical protein